LKTSVNENHTQLEQYISKIKAHVASDNPDVKALRADLSALEGVVASRRGLFQSKSAHEEIVDRAQEEERS
jgi:hypothetical protein